MQQVWNGKYIHSAGVLACPSDPAGNWGGVCYEGDRESYVPPETVRYSYYHPFGLGRGVWGNLMQVKHGNSGGVVCQVHGRSSTPLRSVALPAGTGLNGALPCISGFNSTLVKPPE